MEYRNLGRSGLKVSELCLGTMQFGWSVGEEESFDVLSAAFEAGINFIDTSPEYGVSEYRVGLALAEGWREKIYLQTKVGSHPRFLRDFSKG